MKTRLTLLSVFIGSLLTTPTITAQEVSLSPRVKSQVVMTKENQCQWALWNSFKQNYIKNGRVIDTSDPRLITTSEGQSYGLFFALIANDQATFSSLLNWTEKNLAGGDLTAQLPAWLWGTRPNGSKGVLDANSASDSDLWIAYSLMEAGRLWGNFYYQSLGHLLASRILREETTVVSGLGTVLLPGKQGFILGDNHVRLNPSYVPLQLLTRMDTLFPNYQWAELYQSSVRLIKDTMPKGSSPDWVEWKNDQFKNDKKTKAIGSYNAIRTYLWAGMLPNSDKNKAAILNKMHPVVLELEKGKGMPEIFNTQTGKTKNIGGVGINASTLPLLDAVDSTSIADEYAHGIEASLSTIEKDRYYNSVLTLFGLGWHKGVYQFGNDGRVIPSWTHVCQ
ncbi:cellulase [Aliivibrio finisterrensis]|uniref:cellulase n=1 Tax=Aliivibrio finisterrensis TaxID=511998 RepID=A0A4Q5KXZ0_9GAMM|nr:MULTISPECIES: cellulose synthase complex periplasmic endoglucanase BcsZ [Aliivibrio]MDD9177276.1 cellulose synthase complex periplasmic endoglucanase BcsZ [Aliivibrio sp. A6]RYU54763.1 cellulase [Aliivibrio finisterrensis]RYU56437.1 cellulase [Aliivibrio finisterrensis]RYU61558.1 cellulase [Aliivibrio finisterrensis]RYU66853.1 cellulase [Aliivibrio finisterrensis]